MKNWFVAAVLVLLVVSSSLSAQAQPPNGGDKVVTVMSRNVYHGVDAEIAGVMGAQSYLELLQKVTAVYQGYYARNFYERAEALAEEIDSSRPDLIGLQEAVLVRTQSPADGPASPATTVALDYVQILIDALAARGLTYQVVIESIGLDVEMPSSMGIDVRHTDREVILARADRAAIQLTNPQAGSFATNCVLPGSITGPIVLKRGWVSVDVKVKGDSFRFLSTHLDGDCLPYTTAIQQAQAAEILAGPGASPLPLVFVGDLNSASDGTGVTYNSLISAGFVDAWAEEGRGDGFTCCQADDLLNSVSSLSQRIDLVLLRGAVTAVDAEVYGDRLQDRTPSGLWPSDHVGVVARFLLVHP